MSEKKRKRQEDGSQVDRMKKAAIESSVKAIKISHIEAEEWTPILVSTPGLSLPNNISFKPYNNSNELLLHSAQHPRLDYTAREEPSDGADPHLKHYIGVYDPKKGKLQLVSTRKLVARSTLRHQETSDDSSEEQKAPATGYAARNNLGLAFGTKKSQKAIKNLTVNAINASPSKPKINPDGTEKTKQLDALSEAVLGSMAVQTSSVPTREEMQAQIDEAKPIPRPHLDADNPADVWPATELMGGEHVLKKLPVKDWIDTLKGGGDVPTQVIFVARRLLKVAESGDVLKMRILKYLCLLVGWWRSLKPGRALKVPKLEDMGALVEQFGTELVRDLGNRFSQDNVLNKWKQHYVLTHILALALTVDNFKSDVHHIRQDLKMEVKELKLLYKELGCPLRAPTEAELTDLKLTKAQGATHLFAQLKLPLVLPKSRVLAAPKRR